MTGAEPWAGSGFTAPEGGVTAAEAAWMAYQLTFGFENMPLPDSERERWKDIAQAAIDAATDGTIRALGFTLADVGHFIEAQAAAPEPTLGHALTGEPSDAFLRWNRIGVLDHEGLGNDLSDADRDAVLHLVRSLEGRSPRLADGSGQQSQARP